MNDLRDRLTLSDVVGKKVKLTRAGREFKGCCPFHNEKTPSFYVNDEKQFYHCFGCGAHGDAIGFVMQASNLSFIDAIESLAAEAGMQVPKQTPQEIERAQKQKGLHELLEETTRFFMDALRDSKNSEAMGYLRDRGINDEQIERFKIGYAPANGESLRAHLKAKGFTDQQMIDADVFRKSKRGTDPYAFFRERVMFPVTDRRGRVVAFGGRILPDHLRAPDRGDYKPAKYMNSSDTPLFHKGRMLYGESRARQAAADGKPVIVVEGYLDVIACASAGYEGAVAPLGTALTEEQIQILWKMIPQTEKMPVLCFDGDEAGRRAAARACERLLPHIKPNQSALFAFLPEGQDPDSLIRAQGKKAFDRIIEGAMPLFDFVWSHHTAGRAFSTPEAKAGLSQVLEEEAAKIVDAQVQRYYQQAFRNKLYETFRFGGNRKKAANNRGGAPNPAQGFVLRKPSFSRHNLMAQIILAAIINHPALFDEAEDILGHIEMRNERLDFMRQAVLNLLCMEEEGVDSDAVQDHLKDRGFETELRSVLSESIYTHAGYFRPNVELETARAKWQEMMADISRMAWKEDFKKTGQELSGNFTTETWEKLKALYETNRIDSNQAFGG